MSSVVPEGWSEEYVGEYFDFAIGGTPSRNNELYWDSKEETSNIWVSIKDLKDKFISNSAERISDLGVSKSNVKLLTKGTVLMSFKLSIGRLSISTTPLYTNEAIVGFIEKRPNTIDRDYLYYGLQSWDLLGEVDQAVKGATLNKDKMSRILGLFPPLLEQKKIASILTSVDEVIENTQKQIDKLQDLKKATMNELLTKGIGHTEFKDSELGRIPKSWEVYALSEIGTFSKGRGISKKETLLEGVPCLRYAEIYTVYDFYIKTFKSFISPITAESSRKLIKNEIIFAGSGETVEDIGKSVAFTLDCDAYVGGDSVVFSPRSGLDSIFLSYQLNDNIRRRMLRKLGQGSSVIHIYSSGLQEVLVSLPPLSEQKKISSILISMGEAIEEKLEESRKLQSLKKSLMQDLLYRQSPSDGELMASDELDKVELPALEQLQSLGWSYVEGAELSPDESDERSSWKDVVLEKRLTKSLKRINPWINDENLRKVVRDLTKTIYSNLVEANQAIWTQINQSVSVMQDLGKGNKSQTVHIIDFENPENNEFLCTNQFKVSGVNQNIIPDVMCFVNGMPLAVIECKSPYITNPMEAGIDQLLRYANRRTPENDEGAEKLFHYNLMMVSTHRDKARVGTITSGMEHYLEWKDPYPLNLDDLGDSPSSQEIMLAGLFNHQNFLEVLQNFTIFEPEGGRIIKKIPRYQQFRAVHKTIERLKLGKTSKDKSGVIWHTQGSGKSLTMVFLTVKMRRDPEASGL